MPEPSIPGHNGHPENPVLHLMYTSGSSGRPKGAEYTERHYCAFLNVRPSCLVAPGHALTAWPAEVAPSADGRIT